MNSRDRVLTTLSHKEPDRIPFDLGSGMMTGIHVDAYQNLRDALGLARESKVKFFEPSMQIVFVGEDVCERLEIDTRPALPAWSDSDPLNIQEDEESYFYYDPWGYGLKMPKSAPIYFSLFYHPLRTAENLSELDDYPWPDPVDESRYKDLPGQLENARRKSKAVVLNNICAGTMEVASWLRGIDQFFMDMSLDEKFAGYLLDKVVDIKLGYWETALRKLDGAVDVVIESDDLGAQNNLLISPRMYRKLLKPRHKKILDFIHSHTDAKVFFHSCGAIRPLIPDLIEIGVDILNPVQFNSTGMDAQSLKAEFGKDIVFWGGGVDTQSVLGSATPGEVKDNVRQQLEVLSKDGGFVFATVHNIQANVPPGNILAMREALLEYGIS